jgi:hypothetical protein
MIPFVTCVEWAGAPVVGTAKTIVTPTRIGTNNLLNNPHFAVTPLGVTLA